MLYGNTGQFIRDLLSDETSGAHLRKLSPIDYLILLCLATDEIRPVCRYSRALETKVDEYLEALGSIKSIAYLVD